MSLKSSGHFVRLAGEFKFFAGQNPANRNNVLSSENREKKEKKEKKEN